MFQRGVRGAITVDSNTKNDIECATIELLSEMINENNIEIENISFVIFTLTKDLTAAFPAKFARENFNFKYVPMMCYNEADIENSITKCLRILISYNTDKKQEEIKHIYLKDAKILRQDLR